MLDWKSLCEDVANFAATSIGKKRATELEIATTQQRAEELQRETRAAETLETTLMVTLDFGGIKSDAASTAFRRAAKGGMLAPDLLQGVAGLLVGADRLQRLMRGGWNAARNTANEAAIETLATRLLAHETYPELARSINSMIGEEGVVRETASDAVKTTRQRVAVLEARLKGILGSQDGEITMQGGRWCIAVPQGSGASQGILLSSAGRQAGFMYVEPTAAVPVNNQLVAARAEAMAAEEAVLWSLTSAVVEQLEQLRAVLDVVVWLDITCARYRYTAWIDGTYPTFVPLPSGSLKATREAAAQEPVDSTDEIGHLVFLKRLRHPLLQANYLRQVQEYRQATGQGQRASFMSRASTNRKPSTAPVAAAAVQPPRSIVPVDVTVPLHCRGVVITGPNTGGKTASLKALGLSALMAKAGLGIPAAAPARLPLFSAVLADIGDEQSLSASLSTFSGHLRRIQALRAEADGKGLVLLDEVGTGTDPTEGTALGLALLQTLVAGGQGGAALSVCTTHMSALTALKYEDARFENASAEFDEVELKPTYKLLWGVPGRSNALNIAALLGVPEDVIQDARDFVGTSQKEMDVLIDRLEDARRSTERDEDAAEHSQRRLQELRAQVAPLQLECEALRAKTELARSQIVGRAVAHATSALAKIAAEDRRARQVVDAQVRAEEEAAAAVRRDLELARVQMETNWAPQVGEVVNVPKLGGKARVTAVNKSKVVVDFGTFGSVTVKLAEIRRLS